MARHNEILTGRHNRHLQKLFAMKGPPPAPQLTSEITPVLPMMHGRENRYLEAWNVYFFASAGITGAAGNSPTFRLVNDVGTNVIAVIESILVGTLTADKIDVAFENNVPLVGGHVPSLSVGIAVAMDQRTQPNVAVPLVNQAALIPSTSVNTNTLGTLIRKRQSPAAADLELINDEDQQLVMLPQSALNIFAETAAQTLFINLIWRERFLEDSERT